MKCFLEKYTYFCKRHINVMSYALWSLVILYTFSGIGLRMAGFDIELYVFSLILIFACLLLIGTGHKEKKTWGIIGSIVVIIAIINAFSAFANIGANSLEKMIFNGSIRIIGYMLAAGALYESRLISKSNHKLGLNILVIAVTLQGALSIFAVFMGLSNRLNALVMAVNVEEKAIYRSEERRVGKECRL